MGKQIKHQLYARNAISVLKYITGATSNMSAHLKRRHNIVMESRGNSNVGATSKPRTGKSATGQLRLQEVFALQNKLPANSSRAQEITRSIGMFIAKDMRPYSVVDNGGFKQMVNVLEPRYNIPCRTHFSEKVLPKLYNEAKEAVKSSLKQAPFVALSTDSWTSRATESYNTVTAHYISDWKMKSHILQTTVMHQSHTSDNIAEFLSTVVDNWDLKRHEQMPSLTTDNAKNIVGAAKQIGVDPHIGCIAHTFNLATQRGLQVSQMDRLLGRIRRVVGFFHRSTTASSVLKVKQVILELPHHKLINDVPTRWNSSFDMLNRFLNQQPAIEAALMAKEVKKNARDIQTLSEDDISAGEKVLCLLGPLKTITTILCDEKAPTVSMIHPLKEMTLLQLTPKEGDIPLVAAVKAAIVKDLAPRYTDPSVLLFLHESSCLDPRFKGMPYLSDQRRLEVYNSLAQKAVAINHQINTALIQVKLETPDDNTNGNKENPPLPQLPILDETPTPTPAKTKEEKSDDSPGPSPPHKQKKSALEDLFGDVFVTLEALIDREIFSYKAADSMPLMSSPLAWWKDHEQSYPNLSSLAKKYLCIPASSVASERVFSTAGNIVTAQRSCLSNDQVDMLIFLKKNLE